MRTLIPILIIFLLCGVALADDPPPEEILSESIDLDRQLEKEEALKALLEAEAMLQQGESLRLERMLMALGDDEPLGDHPPSIPPDQIGGHFQQAIEHYMQSSGMPNRRKHLDQLRMLKLLELLDLNEDQEMPFLTAFRGIRQKHREFDELKREAMTELSRLVKESGASDRDIVSVVERCREAEMSKFQSQNLFINEIRDILTAKQLGKFILFQERFEAELLERVRGFHQRGRGKG